MADIEYISGYITEILIFCFAFFWGARFMWKKLYKKQDHKKNKEAEE